MSIGVSYIVQLYNSSKLSSQNNIIIVVRVNFMDNSRGIGRMDKKCVVIAMIILFK